MNDHKKDIELVIRINSTSDENLCLREHSPKVECQRCLVALWCDYERHPEFYS